MRRHMSEDHVPPSELPQQVVNPAERSGAGLGAAAFKLFLSEGKSGLELVVCMHHRSCVVLVVSESTR
jgi:hypothetical protein